MNGMKLTGIKPTGRMHIGNELGMNLMKIDVETIIMIADGHSLTNTNYSSGATENIKENAYIMTAELLAIGCNKNEIYRQSDIPELFKLYWVLCTLLDDGILRRMHAYKDCNAKNINISAALYNYPILMAADILISGASHIVVGIDQQQHVELARVLAERASRVYGVTALAMPEPLIHDVPTLPGLDGRKMSKSYNNVIPATCAPEQLKSLIYKIQTNSQGLNEPKEPEALFKMYSAFASETEISLLHHRYHDGISWKEIKDIVFEHLRLHMEGRNERFISINSNRTYIDELWANSASNVRARSAEIINQIECIFR